MNKVGITTQKASWYLCSRAETQHATLRGGIVSVDFQNFVENAFERLAYVFCSSSSRRPIARTIRLSRWFPSGH